MDEEPEKLADEAEDRRPLCGQLLLAAREDLQISIAEIAKELHLDEHKVVALEQNEFEPLGAPVFAKGHLRKYAQLVKVDESDVLTDYHRLTREQGLPPVVSDRKAPKLPGSPGPWLAVAIVLMLALAAAAAYWFLLVRDAGSTATESSRAVQTAAPAAAPIPIPSGTETPESTGEELLGDPLPADEPSTVDPEPAPVAAVRPAQVSAPVPAAEGELRLSIDFLGDCWTEITNGDGRRLFFDLGREGRTINLSGTPPVSVLFGNVNNVRMRLNGADYRIPDDDRRGLTARFTLFAP